MGDFAIVKFENGEKTIVAANNISGYTRLWRSDPEVWPKSADFFHPDDPSKDQKVSEILHVDSEFLLQHYLFFLHNFSCFFFSGKENCEATFDSLVASEENVDQNIVIQVNFEFANRVDQLENEVKALKAELFSLKRILSGSIPPSVSNNFILLLCNDW